MVYNGNTQPGTNDKFKSHDFYLAFTLSYLEETFSF